MQTSKLNIWIEQLSKKEKRKTHAGQQNTKKHIGFDTYKKNIVPIPQTQIKDKNVVPYQLIPQTHIKNKNVVPYQLIPQTQTKHRNVVPYQPTPVTRNYASIIKSQGLVSAMADTKIVTQDNISSYKIFLIPSNKRKLVRNQIPKNKNSSLDTWEYEYFNHIIDLKKIFSEGIKKIKIFKIDTKSVEFFDNFSRFIKKYSSGEISPYLEKLNENTETIYNQYIITKTD